MKASRKIFVKTGSWVLMSILLFSPATSISQKSGWNEKTSMPTQVVAQSASFSGGKIYLTGGSIDGALHQGDYGDHLLQIYDVQTDSWTEGTPMPTSRWMHGSAEVNSVIYCLGGGWNIPLATNEAYDIVSGIWTTKTPMPYGRFAIGVAAVDNKIYVIGGFGTTQAYPYNQMYDPATDTWTNKASMSTARGGFGTAVVDGKIYVIGGCNSPSSPLKKVEVYDPQTNTWQSKADMPSARFGLVAAAAGKKIYAMGGTPSNYIPSPGKFEVYDTETDTWEQLADLPDSTQWAAGGSWEDKIYLMGGEDMCKLTFPANATILDFVYEYDISTGIKDEQSGVNIPLNLQAVPNPFNDQTSISFTIPGDGPASLEIYNSAGEMIFSRDCTPGTQGIRSINFYKSDLNSGIYLCKAVAGQRSSIIKLVKR
jgi:N-acetylneuraminic acid mutarotase